jgi:hypothetical protein
MDGLVGMCVGRAGNAGRPKPAHPHADFLDVRFGGALRLRQAAVGDDGDPIADLEQLLEILRYHEDRRAGVTQINERLTNRNRGTHIDAPGRLGHDQHLRLLHHLAPDDEFLQVAARQALRLGVGTSALDIEIVDAAPSEIAHYVRSQHACGHHPLAVRGQKRIVDERHRRDCGATLPLFGNEAQPKAATCGCAKAPGRPSTQADHAGILRRPFARQGRQQLLLSIAGNPGDPEDLATAYDQPYLGQVGAERIFGRE